MKSYLAVAAVTIAVLVGTTQGYSQSWSLGANMGLSLLNRSAGFHLTPIAEFLFNRNMGVGSEFSVNTQYSSPVLWYPYFKYYISIPGSRLRPYANAGPVLAFHVSDTPCFGILLGGGVNIPIVGNLYLTPDLLLGPVFGVGGATRNLFLFGNYYGMGVYSASSYRVPGSTVFVFSIRGGVRVEL